MENFKECLVCLQNYNNVERKPYLLPDCGHTFCASCLSQLYRVNKRLCPKCRKVS